MAKGCIGGMSTASEVFLIFTIQLYPCLCNYDAIFFHILTRGKYCKRNSTPEPQYFTLLTSDW